ncbi:MAG: hypothetical protein Q9208_003994 [Pyrenodesmia sp. 3 TL-2023]
MGSLLPEELLASLNDSIRCRELQIQQLACLIASDFPSPPNLVLHGTQTTGKSLTVNALLQAIEHPSAVIRSKECITTRHLLERTLSGVQDALGDAVPLTDGRCESISAFVVQLQRLLDGQKKFILVFDNIDRQREAAPTLLPALARLNETIPNLTTLFIITSPRPHLFHKPGIPHIHFPPYTRAELISLVSASPLPLQPPPSETPPPASANPPSSLSQADLDFLWPRFATAVHDSLAQPASNSLPALRTLCSRLWHPFIAPILAHQYTPREFSKLMVRNRYLFQSEDALKESIIPLPPQPQHPSSSSLNSQAATKKQTTTTLHLPTLPAQLLIVAYLASHNAPKHDTLLFSKYSTSRRRRRGGGGTMAPRTPRKKAANRTISRQMLGPQGWGMERLLAIHAALFKYDDYEENTDGDRARKRNKGGGGGSGAGAAELLTQFATLVGMRLIVRAGAAGADPLEAGGGKWKINVGGTYVRQVARGLRFDIDSYILE